MFGSRGVKRVRKFFTAVAENPNSTLSVCSFGIFVDSVAYSMILPLIPYYVRRLNTTDEKIGLIVSFFAVGAFVIQPFIGMFGDRFGRKYPMIFGLILTGAATMAYIFIDSFWTLVAARILQGLGSVLTWANSIPTIADIFPPEKLATAMSIANSANFVGNLLGPLIGGYMFDKWGYDSPFIAVAILCIVDGVARMILFPAITRPPAKEKSQAARSSLRTESLYISAADPDASRVTDADESLVTDADTSLVTDAGASLATDAGASLATDAGASLATDAGTDRGDGPDEERTGRERSARAATGRPDQRDNTDINTDTEAGRPETRYVVPDHIDDPPGPSGDNGIPSEKRLVSFGGDGGGRKGEDKSDEKREKPVVLLFAPLVVLVFFSNFLTALFLEFVLTLYPLHLERIWGYSSTQIGLLLALMGVMSAIGSWSIGALLGRWPSLRIERVFAVVMFLTATTTPFVALPSLLEEGRGVARSTGAQALLAVTFSICGLGVGMWGTLPHTLLGWILKKVIRPANNINGLFYGVMGSMYALGMFMGPALVGLCLGAWGDAHLLYILLVPGSAAFLYSLALVALYTPCERSLRDRLDRASLH